MIDFYDVIDWLSEVAFTAGTIIDTATNAQPPTKLVYGTLEYCRIVYCPREC